MTWSMKLMLRSQESFGNSKLIFRRFAIVFFHRRLEQVASPPGDDCPSVDSSAFSGFPYCSLSILSTLIIPNNSLSFLSILYYSWLFHIIHCLSLPFLIIPFLMNPCYSLPFLINRYHSVLLLIIPYHCKSKYTNLLKHKRIWNWSTGCEGTIQKWNESFPGVKKCQVKGSPLSGCQVYRWSYFQNDDDDRNNTKFFNWFSRYAKSKRPSPMWHNVQENSACSWKSTPMTKRCKSRRREFSEWCWLSTWFKLEHWCLRSSSGVVLRYIIFFEYYFTYFPISSLWPPGFHMFSCLTTIMTTRLKLRRVEMASTVSQDRPRTSRL